MKAYTVEYRLHEGAEVAEITIMAENKADAYDKAMYEAIPEAAGEYPYSAWVAAVTYKSGKVKTFNAHEGMAY